MNVHTKFGDHAYVNSLESYHAETLTYYVELVAAKKSTFLKLSFITPASLITPVSLITPASLITPFSDINWMLLVGVLGGLIVSMWDCKSYNWLV